MDIFLRTRTLVLVIILLLCLNVVLLVLCLTGRSGAPPSPAPQPGAVERQRLEQLLTSEMNFDSWQVERFFYLREEHRTRMDVHHETMRRLKNQLFDGVLDEQPVLSDSLLLRTQETQDAIERETFRYLLEIRLLCTPEQQVRLKGLIHELLRPKKPKR
jgi:hypothetical protein